MHISSTIKSVTDSLKSFPRKATSLLWTLFLFTKSDIKTTLVPIVSPLYTLLVSLMKYCTGHSRRGSGTCLVVAPLRRRVLVDLAAFVSIHDLEPVMLYDGGNRGHQQ